MKKPSLIIKSAKLSEEEIRSLHTAMEALPTGFPLIPSMMDKFDYWVQENGASLTKHKGKQSKKHANYFVGWRVTDEQIWKNVVKVQDAIFVHEPGFTDCRYTPQMLHVTLCTVGLDTPEDVAHCAAVLTKLQPEIARALPRSVKNVPIRIKGVDHFTKRVIYAKPEFSQEYLDFVDHLTACLQREGVDIRGGHGYVPHMTMMKVNRDAEIKAGKKCIEPSAFSGVSDIEFGSQLFDNMHLCEMGRRRRDDGFYVTPVSFTL